MRMPGATPGRAPEVRRKPQSQAPHSSRRSLCCIRFGTSSFPFRFIVYLKKEVLPETFACKVRRWRVSTSANKASLPHQHVFRPRVSFKRPAAMPAPGSARRGATTVLEDVATHGKNVKNVTARTL